MNTPETPKSLVLYLREHASQLAKWNQGFLASMELRLRQEKAITPKMMEKLGTLFMTIQGVTDLPPDELGSL